jgi:tRNA(His) guanylyltransferase
MKDPLGDRIKGQYENRTRFYLPRRTYTVIRLDGKSFHTLTRGMTRPFDQSMVDAMDYTTMKLCEHVEGVVFGYTQSDEISLLLTDFATPTTQAWFDGNLQKLVSVSASIATAHFNQALNSYWSQRVAYFDSRAFTIPDFIEVYNYFVWRQEDCIRNSISGTAQSRFSHKTLQGKKCSEMLEMLEQDGSPWELYPVGFRHGRFFEPSPVKQDVTYQDKKTGEEKVAKDVVRTTWKAAEGLPRFISNPKWLRDRIPSYV